MHLKSLLLCTSPCDQRRSLPNAKKNQSDLPSRQHGVLCLRTNLLLTANKQRADSNKGALLGPIPLVKDDCRCRAAAPPSSGKGNFKMCFSPRGKV